MAVMITPKAFILVIVPVPTLPELGDEDARDVRESTATCVTSGDCDVYYVTQPLDQEPGFDATSSTCDLSRLPGKGGRMGGKT